MTKFLLDCVVPCSPEGCEPHNHCCENFSSRLPDTLDI